mmetsp:Transcript_22046/g.66130  ORF Transcript_22046/g.66130 Transcript_22046/m.66130 type:complete len:325 (+) Transcript_22046:1823-2797(+)
MANVILNTDHKESIVQAVTSFKQFKEYERQRGGTPEMLKFSRNYARGLLLLFSGPSGTGKTLTANALAAYLGMKVLLVNFNSIESSRGSQSSLQSLFREAEIHNAVLFFDECESMFAKRGHGGSSQMTMLLTEIERHTGIIFLATNRPMDLDEAMHRRITAAFEFKQPNHMERAAIWRIHTVDAGVPMRDDIDWEEIAIRYELAGGYIKNAVLSALLLAISRDGPEKPVVCQEDIVKGCAAQVRGTLRMKSFQDREVPTCGLDALVVPKDISTSLTDIIQLEKARSILFGSWGFGDKMRAQQSTAVLFSGPSGTGKSMAASAIG